MIGHYLVTGIMFIVHVSEEFGAFHIEFIRPQLARLARTPPAIPRRLP
jgi:hypothetical protein